MPSPRPLWGAISQSDGGEAAAKRFITGVFKNAEVLPKDAREATDTFVKRGQGDALLNWETEGILAKRSGALPGGYRVFSPNVLTEMSITPADQKAYADNALRPVTPEGKSYARGKFPNVKFFRIADLGGWAETDKKFFGKGGVWDQIFAQNR
jgi:sulfate transport system substrate-binding protein